MKKYTALLLSACLLSSASLAQVSGDRRLPFVVEADTASYSDITQTSVFTGRVILTQGTTRIEADKIETIVDPEGYQFATASMTGGGLVRFQQQRAGSNEVIKAKGRQVIYDGKQNLVVLSQNAQMRRLSPSGRLIDQIDGDELVYNQLTEIFESRVIPGASGRTRVIVTPNSQAK